MTPKETLHAPCRARRSGGGPHPGCRLPCLRRTPEDSVVQLRHAYANFCIDSNSSGAVYVGGCGRDNPHQQWQWIPRGEGKVILRNVGTDRCLDNNASRSVYTGSCGVNNNYQIWQYTVGRTGDVALKSLATKTCLSGRTGDGMFMADCDGLDEIWITDIISS